jgi:hypothetical protein
MSAAQRGVLTLAARPTVATTALLPHHTHTAQASGNLHIQTWKDTGATVRSFISNNIWRAPIAACALGGLMVVLFNLMAFIVLLRSARKRMGWVACRMMHQPGAGQPATEAELQHPHADASAHLSTRPCPALSSCRKSIAKKAGAGFGEGFVVAWSFVMAFFCLLAGLVLQGFTTTVDTQLTAGALWQLPGVVQRHTDVSS